MGTRSIRQFSSTNINAGGPGSGSAGTPLYQAWGNANEVDLVEPFNTSSYNSLQAQVSRRMSSGAQVGAVYTFSKAINYTDAADTNLTWSWQPMWSRNKALAGYDRTHNFQLYGTYELPFGHGRRWAENGIAAAIAGGWTVSGILSRESGTPFTVTSSGASVNAPGNAQTANQVLSNVRILGGHGPTSPISTRMLLRR